MDGLNRRPDQRLTRSSEVGSPGTAPVTRRAFAGLVTAALGFGFSCKNSPTAPTDPDAARLVFAETTSAETAGLIVFPGSIPVQDRIAKVRTDLLFNARVGDKLVFNLFPNRRYEVQLASRKNSIDVGHERDIDWLADIVGANQFAGVSLGLQPQGVISGFLTVAPISGLPAAYFDIDAAYLPNAGGPVPNFAYLRERRIS